MAATLQDIADEVNAFHELPLAAQARIDEVVRAVRDETSASLVLTGPPATGKQTFVRAIHEAATSGQGDTRILYITNHGGREGWQAEFFSRISRVRSTNLAEYYDAMHLVSAQGFFHEISDQLDQLLQDDQVTVTWKEAYCRVVTLTQGIDGVTYDKETGLTAVVRLPLIRTMIDRRGEVHSGTVEFTRCRLLR